MVEALAPFRGSGELTDALLLRGGLPLALAQLELDDDTPLLDLDDPRVLARKRLRPSQIATRTRSTTQRHAAALFEDDTELGGLRWWSTFEASWENVTLFNRAAPTLKLVDCTQLTMHDAAVTDAAAFLGLRIRG